MRRCSLIVACLVCGVGANIAIAWFCAYSWSALPLSYSCHTADRSTQFDWPCPPPPSWPRPERVEHWRGFGVEITLAESVNPVTLSGHDSSAPWGSMRLVRAGWPFRAFQSVDSLGTDGDRWPDAVFANGSSMNSRLVFASLRQGMFWLRPQQSGPPTLAATLPIYPRWPGFAFNTVLFAAVPWFTRLAWRHWLRGRRLNRGLCPHCAYPVASSRACPECGAMM